MKTLGDIIEVIFAVLVFTLVLVVIGLGIGLGIAIGEQLRDRAATNYHPAGSDQRPGADVSLGESDKRVSPFPREAAGQVQI